MLYVAGPKNTEREIDRISFSTYNYRNHNNWINWPSFGGEYLTGPGDTISISQRPLR